MSGRAGSPKLNSWRPMRRTTILLALGQQSEPLRTRERTTTSLGSPRSIQKRRRLQPVGCNSGLHQSGPSLTTTSTMFARPKALETTLANSLETPQPCSELRWKLVFIPRFSRWARKSSRTQTPPTHSLASEVTPAGPHGHALASGRLESQTPTSVILRLVIASCMQRRSGTLRELRRPLPLMEGSM